MWVPYSLAARLLVREVSLERGVLVPHAPELAFFAVRGRRRGRPEFPREARIARLGALEVVARARRRRGTSRAWWRQVARTMYATSLSLDSAATLNDLREAVSTLEETERTARRVLGGAHPIAAAIEGDLRNARAALRVREGA